MRRRGDDVDVTDAPVLACGAVSCSSLLSLPPASAFHTNPHRPPQAATCPAACWSTSSPAPWTRSAPAPSAASSALVRFLCALCVYACYRGRSEGDRGDWLTE